MKICPKCRQTYSDENLNFCLNDGEFLNNFDDAPPTVMMDPPRVTNQNWQQPSGQYQPPAPWNNQQSMSNQPPGAMQTNKNLDQTLPIVSLVMGISSLLLICCYGGFWLGIPAAIIGFLGMKNADSDPLNYGGRGLAIGGMILGIISFLLAVGFVLIAVFSNIK